MGFIGPSIPDTSRNKSDKSENNVSNSDETDTFSHAPEQKMIGPSLPPHLVNRNKFAQGDEEDGLSNGTVMQLPDRTGVQQNERPRRGNSDEGKTDFEGLKQIKIERELFPQMEDNDSFGPLPLPEELKEMYQQDEFQAKLAMIESRASTSMVGQENNINKKEDSSLERSEWMLVPPEKRRLGSQMKSRVFSQSKIDQDQQNREGNSEWTKIQSPFLAKSERKKREHEESDDLKETTANDNKKNNIVTKRKVCTEEERNLLSSIESARGKSLMDQHVLSYSTSTSLNSSNGSVNNEPSILRQPFNRERDIVGRRIDPSKKKEFLEKSRQLNKKFSHGSKVFL